MNNRFILIIIVQAILLLMASCQHDEPYDPIKPESERTVLFLTPKGEIYNQDQELVVTLPYCTYASQIISDKGDYFVSGTTDNEKEGYWKNGKWNTLHVDFKDDVNHWIDGMAKWDYYIYLLDYPNVLKNSGIFRLEDAGRYLPAKQALAVSEGKCYVVGHKITDNSHGEYLPVLYTEHKGAFTYEMLPVFNKAIRGECACVYAYDRNHCLIGGSINGWPVLWDDKQLQVLPLSEASFDEYDEDASLGEVVSVTKCNDDIYAGGTEDSKDKLSVATVWHNGEISHLEYYPETSMASELIEIMTYGTDVYAVTLEYYYDDDEFVTTTILWKNGSPVRAYPRMQTTSFTVI